jgi:hypothetical protein
MRQADRTTKNIERCFHPVSHYKTIADVLNDAKLSADEKRVILSSWASDMYVVESHPTLREIPAIPHRLRLDDILAALKHLGDKSRGGLVMRLTRFGKLDCRASEKPLRVIGRQAATVQSRPEQPSLDNSRGPP